MECVAKSCKVVTKTIHVCSVIEENISRGLLNTLSLNVVRNIDYVIICPLVSIDVPILKRLSEKQCCIDWINRSVALNLNWMQQFRDCLVN